MEKFTNKYSSVPYFQKAEEDGNEVFANQLIDIYVNYALSVSERF